MPGKFKARAELMAVAFHTHAIARRVGMPQSVVGEQNLANVCPRPFWRDAQHDALQFSQEIDS